MFDFIRFEIELAKYKYLENDFKAVTAKHELFVLKLSL